MLKCRDKHKSLFLTEAKGGGGVFFLIIIFINVVIITASGWYQVEHMKLYDSSILIAL